MITDANLKLPTANPSSQVVPAKCVCLGLKHCAIVTTNLDSVERLCSVFAGEPITAAMGTRAKVIPVESIISVGKSETLNSTIIAYAAGGKDKFIRITTPKLSLYGKVFDMVRMRLGPNQPVREGPYPFGFYCTIFGIFGLVLGIMAAGLCGIAADAQRGNMPAPSGRPRPVAKGQRHCNRCCRHCRNDRAAKYDSPELRHSRYLCR